MTKTKTKPKTNPDNAFLLATLGVLGLSGTVGVIAWRRARKADAAKPSSNSSPTAPTSPARSLADTAARLRAELLRLEGCTIKWALGEASRTALLTHQDDFFVPAIADAQTKGLITPDEVTAHVASVLVPGCPWPPPLIDDFDIEAAVAGELSALQEQMWSVAQASAAVQLYLTIRSVVVTARNNRRG